ncbi:hypothetical protein M6B38_224745 [Iris pallida]|uniref:Uncharacterized protein n=1 Tax=Iris pallida TaxID=29817 RepID=A0AAX6DUL3_IRIPA|nr:hypothetical protein M6B38_224745 [Iris pallida]
MTRHVLYGCVAWRCITVLRKFYLEPGRDTSFNGGPCRSDLETYIG